MDWKSLLGIAGAVAAWIWSVFTWYKSQVEQRSQHEFARKESLYKELLRVLSVFYKGGPKTGAEPFLEQYRLSWIYAPDDVVRALNSFLDTQKIEATEELLPPHEQAAIRSRRDACGSQKLASLITAMRRDVFQSAGKKTDLTPLDVRHCS